MFFFPYNLSKRINQQPGIGLLEINDCSLYNIGDRLILGNIPSDTLPYYRILLFENYVNRRLCSPLVLKIIQQLFMINHLHLESAFRNLFYIPLNFQRIHLYQKGIIVFLQKQKIRSLSISKRCLNLFKVLMVTEFNTIFY